METLSGLRCSTAVAHFPFPRRSRTSRRHRDVFLVTNQSVSSLKTSVSPESELLEEEVLRTFLKDRKLTGDFISKASDIIWQRDALKLINDDALDPHDDFQQQNLSLENNGGFLKLSRTHKWVVGDDSAPLNKKTVAKALQDDREKRKKLNLLQYEALKRELTLLSVGIGTACSGYCLVVLSVQAAISYAIGVLFSCLYLQLLCQHADNLSKEMVPRIFKQKRRKKIGIRSEDLSDFLERSIKGSGIALSSPRLVIPAAIYGLWVLSYQYIKSDFFDFQLVPAMLGMFVYKAAALVQVYRDNEDLKFIFPENEEGSSY
ncbi:uncharacterized protein LOC116210578 isoform X2 [Punica granatum]|uniref:Uncharacterized protein LOC116210578 isoform X2 n=2 Tax=Punica granatum TaxID=22663 RepID=A0A6P8E4K9_PUNGR|nr:uncharacterized protein LOC116210578 isoform X2 [Punica granatum]